MYLVPFHVACAIFTGFPINQIQTVFHVFVCYLEWLVFFSVTRLVNVLLVRGKLESIFINPCSPWARYLINTCINGWRHRIEYTQVQKLSNLLPKCTCADIKTTNSTKPLHVLAYSLFYLHLTRNRFHSTLHPVEDRQETCPTYVKLTSFTFVMSQ